MNTKHTTTENIECPQCGHSFAANQAFQDHILSEAKVLADREIAKAAEKHKDELKLARNATDQEIEQRAQKISADKTDKYLAEARVANKEASELRLDLKKAESELQSQKENQASIIELARTEGAEATARKLKSDFALREKELLEQQKIMQRNFDKFKEKGANKSAPILGDAGQGEALDILENLFPNDHIKEVKKGEAGADCHWTIISNGKRISKINLEVKNTQTFSNKWVEKLKNDLVENSASIGIIVTKTMPAGKETFHFNNGILVCNFFEFDTIAKVLRHQQIEQSRKISQELVRDTNANQLFDYIVGPEFAHSLEKLLRPIFKQKELLERDKNNAKKAFKSRDMAIQDSIDGAILLAAGLEHYLGAEVTNKIGFEKYELLEIKDEGDDTNG